MWLPFSHFCYLIVLKLTSKTWSFVCCNLHIEIMLDLNNSIISETYFVCVQGETALFLARE